MITDHHLNMVDHQYSYQGQMSLIWYPQRKLNQGCIYWEEVVMNAWQAMAYCGEGDVLNKLNAGAVKATQ